jgi:hypothetical protein
MKKLDIVAINRHIPKLGLKTGDVGTIVDACPVGYDVEFRDAAGRTTTVATIDCHDLRLAEVNDLARLQQQEAVASACRQRSVNSEFLFVAYLFAAVFPVLGVAFSIYLTLRRERMYSYGVFAVSAALIAFWRFVLLR